MQNPIVWQAGSNNPDNPSYLDAIRQWWQHLHDREVSWQQRLLPSGGNVKDLDWQPQRFDEVFALQNPNLRGITLYWRKPDSPQERNITAAKLELDRINSCIYIYPQSQSQVVLRVGLPQITYQAIELDSPQFIYVADREPSMLIIRDSQQQIEVKVTLSRDRLERLKRQLLG
jgi:hypothetical protein